MRARQGAAEASRPRIPPGRARSEGTSMRTMSRLALRVWYRFLRVGVAAAGASAATLDTVKGKGVLTCGANTGLGGFGLPDDKGNWTGLDVDFCRAMAAAVFGDATKIKFVAARRQEPLHGASVGRGRRPVPQHDLDLVAREHARPAVRAGHLLRRPGLHGPQEDEHRLGQGARRRLGLRAAGHDDRAQPRGLLPHATT